MMLGRDRTRARKSCNFNQHHFLGWVGGCVGGRACHLEGTNFSIYMPTHPPMLLFLQRARSVITGQIEAMHDHSALARPFSFHLEGRPGMSDVSPPLPLSGISGLSFDSTLLSPLLFFSLVLLLCLSYLFSAC